MASDARLLPQEVIRNKRDGRTLSTDEIEFVIAGLTDGSVSDAQAAAFAMAVFFSGMGADERVALTRAMTRSGEVLDWSSAGLGGPVVDKHSTGGIGDKVSLMLAPILAACGAHVPMISGRGLGHAGGTLDKLDSIPGYDTAPDLARFRRVVREVGCAIIGQTAELAPADRRLYSIRDVTATVESVPLIVASILSKKLAAGLDALCMDVKVGSGAFLPKLDDALELAQAIVDVGNGAGLRTSALLTDMDQVLGRNAGNALEVREAVDYLTGGTRDRRLHRVTMELCVELLIQGGLASDEAAAHERINLALQRGSPVERFSKMAAALGAPNDFVEHIEDYLPAAPIVQPVQLEASGVVAAIDGRALGLAIIGLSGGRTRTDQPIDHAVGLAEIACIGEDVGPGRPIAVVHARDAAAAEGAVRAVRAAVRVSDHAAPVGPVVLRRLGAGAVMQKGTT